MTEKGSDELLLELIDDPDTIDDAAVDDEERLGEEEDRVIAAGPATDEPGEQHPDPDETPSGDPPEYDPLPPEEED